MGSEFRTDISFNYQLNALYAGRADFISAKITTMIKAPTTSSYTISSSFDDGTTLYFDSVVKYNKFAVVYPDAGQFTVNLVQNLYYPVYIYYSEYDNPAFFTNTWSIGGAGAVAIPASVFNLAALVGSSPYTISSMVSV